jgi:hypothetical protein
VAELPSAEDAGDEVLIFVPDDGRNSGVPLGRFGNVVIYTEVIPVLPAKHR